MNQPIQFIEVSLDQRPVGKLAMTPDHLCAFEYDSDYLKVSTSISPFHLPLKQGVFIGKREPFQGLFGVFNDSLPDGWGKLLTDRYLLKQGINPSQLTHLARLSLIGDTGMGALTYRPIALLGEPAPTNDINRLAAEVQLILNKEYNGQLETLFHQGGSSGGASPKVLINIDQEDWLVKFKASGDPDNIGEIEYQYSLAAKACGIEMPDTKLFENKYFGVRRFDKVADSRYHIHSASGLLYASHRYPSIDYTDLIKATWLLTQDVEQALKMFRQMTFNILTHNRDDHAKNFSFILKGGQWQLSPAYDLVYSEGFNGQHTTTVAGNGHPTIKDALLVAKQTSLPQKKAQLIIDEVTEGCRQIKDLIL